MIISTTQHRQLSRNGAPTDYVAAQPLPGETLAAQAEDTVDILSPDGKVLHSSPGQNLEANLQGDVFWTRDQNIVKWTPEKGESTFANGYSQFLPGPDGKVFAIGQDREGGEFGVPTVDLLDADGKMVSRSPLPESFHITGAYLSHDQRKALIGGWSEKYSDVYSRPSSVFSLEVDPDGQLKVTREHSGNLNALSTKDCQPLLLQDGRIAVAEQLDYTIAGRKADKDHVWEILGPSAAPGGRLVNIGGTDAPASTLDEQLQAVYPGQQERHYEPSEGTPVWAPLGLSQDGLVDLTPLAPASAPILETRKPSALRSTILPLSSGGLGLGAAAALFAVGLGPVGIGVGLLGLAGAGALKWLGSRSEQQEVRQERPLPAVPRLVDPKLGESLRDSLGLKQASRQAYGAATVSLGDDKVVVEFPTGMVATKQGEGKELEVHLYGPTGDEKSLPEIESFQFDAEAGSLAINGTVYDLRNSAVSHGNLRVQNGQISSTDGSNPTYLGRGKFDALTLPFLPEVFSDTVGYEKAHASGEVFTRSRVAVGACESFRSVEVIDTVKAPEFAADGSLKENQETVTGTGYKVTLNNGRVLMGDGEGATLDGKELKHTSLSFDGEAVTLRKEEYGGYYERKAKDSLWDQLGEILVPGTREYETVEGKGEQVSRQLDLSIHADGKVVLTEYQRESNLYGAPFKQTSQSVAKVGDPQIGDNFEKLL